MGNFVIYTTHHSIHKVVKCKRLQEIHVTQCRNKKYTQNCSGKTCCKTAAQMEG